MQRRRWPEEGAPHASGRLASLHRLFRAGREQTPPPALRVGGAAADHLQVVERLALHHALAARNLARGEAGRTDPIG